MVVLSTRTGSGRGAGFQLAIMLVTASWALAPLQAAEPIPVRAGPVSMVFDTENVFVRYIRVGKHEVRRGSNAPIR